MKEKMFGHQPIKRLERRHIFPLKSFGDLFGDEYDHPFNEEIE